jgi:2-polyprenyl-6-methoxyphenol hydroxylase-like FAD-dependent oxidoreductase
LLDLNVDEMINRNAKEELCDNNGNGEPMVFSIMRDSLQNLLYNAATQSLESNNVNVVMKPNQRCIRVDETKDGINLYFADGDVETKFDMVFVADGVNSRIGRLINGLDEGNH